MPVFFLFDLECVLRSEGSQFTAGGMNKEGVSPVIIQQILGHADISTTMIYAHLAPDTVKKAMETAFE